MKSEPFELKIENNVLQDISDRLKKSRLPEDFGNSKWDYGTEKNYLSNLLEYWISEYDWRKTEKEINSFPNFEIHLIFITKFKEPFYI